MPSMPSLKGGRETHNSEEMIRRVISHGKTFAFSDDISHLNCDRAAKKPQLGFQLQHLRQQQHEILRQQNITEQATSRTTTVTTARVRFQTPPDQFIGFIQ